MTTFVFDASAVLRFLDKELGWERVANVLTDSMRQKVEIVISAVQWGEIAGGVRRKSGPSAEERALGLLESFPIRIEPATEQRAIHAAELKVDRKIAYADAFALDLAMESPQYILLTSDYGFKAVDDLACIEYLPAK